MIARRMMLGSGIAFFGMTMALAPVSSASASQHSLCSLVKAERASQLKQTAATAKALEEGDWATAKKNLLASFNGEAKVEQAAVVALASAPAKVRAAMVVALKFVASEKTAIEDSTSVAQFESSLEAAAENPKLVSAEKTLDGYQTDRCGSVTSTT